MALWATAKTACVGSSLDRVWLSAHINAIPIDLAFAKGVYHVICGLLSSLGNGLDSVLQKSAFQFGTIEKDVLSVRFVMRYAASAC